MERLKQKLLILEKLEPRCLLSGFWEGIDIDGDDVVIELTGPGEFTVYTTEADLGEYLEGIELEGTAPSSKLFIDVYPNGGDGFVDVGYIDATGLALKEISMYGFLGDLEIGALDKLYLDGNLIFEDGPTYWTINSDVKRIHVFGGVENLDLAVAGNLKKVVIEGDVTTSTLAVDGQLRRMQIYGNVTESYLFSNYKLKNLSIYGHVDFSVIETNDTLNKLYVGYDIFDSEIFAGWQIKKIVTDGSLENTLVESAGKIRLLDVWDWIIDSEIVAGPEGINRIYAYNADNSSVDTSGYIGRVHLDAYGGNERWDELVISFEDVWYWPVYDDLYINSYYAGGGYNYYYDPYYWDTYYYDDFYYYDPLYVDYYSDPYYYDSYYYDTYYVDDYYYVDAYYYDTFAWGVSFDWWW
ncbi:MAG: hypothetical protein GY869_22530 [Planctomycetes bacterium]|nr:hypothetical protein [Planctomycetota bacterium]